MREREYFKEFWKGMEHSGNIYIADIYDGLILS